MSTTASPAAVHCAKVYTSSGIVFPATQNASGDANTLDDYEEGSWTPRITDGTDTAVVGGNNEGAYTKIGRVVHLTAYITVSDLTDATTGAEVGNINISGLPFTVGNDHQYYGAVTVGYTAGLAITAGHSVTGYVMTNQPKIQVLVYDSTTGATNMTGGELTDDGEMMIQATYFI